MWHIEAPAGVVEVEVHGPYPGQYATVAVPYEDLDPWRIHVTLPPPGVRGRVLDNRGRPVAGATVRWRVNGEWRGDGVRAGKDGDFEIGLGKPSAGRELVTYAPPFHPKAFRGAMLPRDPLFELVPRPLLEGVCTSPQGEPLAGVELRLMVIGDAKRTASLRANKYPWAARLFELGFQGADGNQRVRSDVVVRSRADGRFTAPLPFPGLVRATASGEGLVFRDFDVDLTDGGVADETVILESSPLKGDHLVVMTADGQPIPGIFVWLQEDRIGLDQRTYCSLSLRTDERGRGPRGRFRDGLAVPITLTQDSDAQEEQALLPNNVPAFTARIRKGMLLRLPAQEPR